MMRWQKAARISIGIGVVVFTLVVIMVLRTRRPPAEPTATPRTDAHAVIESAGRIKVSRSTPDGKLVFSLTAERHFTYQDGRTKLEQAVLTLPDRGGRTLHIASDHMEITAPPDKPGDLAAANMNGNVRLTADDGLVVTSREASYDEPTGILNVPGPVEFARGRLKGSGVGATYDRDRDVLWLLKEARVAVAADEKGQGAAEGSAESAGYARAEHYMRLTGKGRIVGEGRTVEGDDITIQMSEDDRTMRTMQLRGNSRITGSGASAQNMAARDIDLTYGEDGKALQGATLVENASLQLPAAGSATAARRVTGQTITMAFAPDGTSVTKLDATEPVQVELPAGGGAPGRRITATSLAASGPPEGGLRSATFTGKVEFRETRPGGRGTAPAERVARSQRLIVETAPGFGDIQQADFRGNVRFEDGATTAEAPRALYVVAKDTLQLSPSGDPGSPPRIVDERMAVDARNLTIALESHRLSADTDVRSSLNPQRKAANGSKKPAAQPAGGAAKLPSMLKSDEPVFVNSNTLEYDGTSTAVYSGAARLVQGQTSVVGDTIIIDDTNGNLTAKGTVRTVMFFDDVDPKTKVRTPTRTEGTADQLVYEDAKRLATYTTLDPAKGPLARVVGAQGDLTAVTIELFMKPKVNELERAEADGQVSVKEGQRLAKGAHLTYTAADETYVMNGNPLEVDRYAPGECTKTMGVTLRFRRGEDTLLVDGIPGVTPFNTKPIACPPGAGA